MVFERRPPSPSIQTSDGVVKGAKRIKKGGLTFSLDLVTLREGEVRSKKVVVIKVGHWREEGRGGGGVEGTKCRALKSQKYRVDRYLSNGV